MGVAVTPLRAAEIERVSKFYEALRGEIISNNAGERVGALMGLVTLGILRVAVRDSCAASLFIGNLGIRGRL